MALHIGVLLLNTPQLLDLAAIDLFYMTTPTYLTACSLPTPLLSLARPLTIHYIAPQTPVSTTSNLTILPTHTLSSPDIAPHTLDILLIPGPSPQAHIPEDILDFVAAHHAAGTDILSICTAALVIASAGVSAGRRVTGPRLMIPELRARFPESNWVDGRVVRDRNLWSCGGITNGRDLVAAYLCEKFPAPLVNVVLATADIPRPDYGSWMDRGYMLWQVVRAVPRYLGLVNSAQ